MTLFYLDYQMNSVYGSDDMPGLGEFVLIGYDSPPNSNIQQVVVAASYQVSQSLRSINLYKVVGENKDNLMLW